MTTIPVLLSEDIHRTALAHASALGTTDRPLPPGVLYAPLDDETTSWINRIWDSAEEALRRAYRDGLAVARPYIDAVSNLLGRLGEELSNRADEVRSAIAARLDAYIREVIDAALRRVQATINLGGKEFRMKSVKIDQQITFSGTLKASLEGLCEFVAEGKLALAAEYAAE